MLPHMVSKNFGQKTASKFYSKASVECNTESKWSTGEEKDTASHKLFIIKIFHLIALLASLAK